MNTKVQQSESIPNLSTNTSSKNLHVRVREEILRDIIASGARPGERFGTETELAQQLNVCRNTVRKAMSQLENEGYISRRRRVGTIVGNKISTLDVSNISNDSQAAHTENQRQRMIVTLPCWDDSTEGFFSSKILRQLVSPEFDPPLSVEIRHANDRLDPLLHRDVIILTINPLPEMILQLKQLSDQGTRIIAAVPRNIFPNMVNICADSRQAVCNAVKHFYAIGHKMVGIINGMQEHFDFRQRLAGYLDAHRELNIPIQPNALLQVTDMEREITPDVVHVSAWVCSYGAAVNKVHEECLKHGLSIPQDVSIVSLDDPIDEGIKTLGKGLSVIRPDFAATAAVVRDCIKNWQDTLRGKVVIIPMEKVERETIAPPKTAGKQS